jgi:hypothetical protein
MPLIFVMVKWRWLRPSSWSAGSLVEIQTTESAVLSLAVSGSRLRIEMRTFSLAAIVGCLSLWVAGPVLGDDFRYIERTADGGKLEYIEDIPVLTLSGTPEEMAAQQVALIKDVMQPLLETPQRVLGQFGLNSKLVLPLASVAARTMSANSPERFRKELDALAKGSESDPSLLYIGNCLVELRRMGGCSAFVVTPDQSQTGEMLFGRNFDFPTFDVLDKYSCVMVVRPEGRHAFASVTVPGLIGVVSGMNDAGLAIATLDVYAAKDGSSVFDLHGAPLALTFRQILEECATVDEAQALLEKTPRTTWMNLVACDPTTAAVFELTPKTVGRRNPEGTVLRCTNHFELPELSENRGCWRYFTLGKLMEFQEGRKYDVEDVHRAMHAVNQGELTFQTMIFEPGSKSLRVAFGPGPVTRKPLSKLDLSPLFEAPRPANSTENAAR